MIRGYQEIERQRWDEFVSESDEAWFFHRQEWVEWAGEECEENHSVAFTEGDALLAILPLYLSTLGMGHFSEVTLHTGLHRSAGLAVRNGLNGADRKRIEREVFEYIDTVAARNCVDRVHLSEPVIAPRFFVDPASPRFWDDTEGYSDGVYYGDLGLRPFPGGVTAADDQIFDLSVPRSEEDIDRAIPSPVRRAVRKAKRGGLELEVRRPSIPLGEEYWRLAQASAERTGETLAPKERVLAEFEKWKDHYLFFLARRQGDLIAAVTVLVFKGFCSFRTGISDPETLHLRPNDFLHYEIIRWGFHKGLQGYRLGPYFRESWPGTPIRNMPAFKRKFANTTRRSREANRFFGNPFYECGAVQEIRLRTLRDSLARRERNSSPIEEALAPYGLRSRLSREMCDFVEEEFANSFACEFAGGKRFAEWITERLHGSRAELEKAARRDGWGFPNERSVFLYEPLLERERKAKFEGAACDEICMRIATRLAEKFSLALLAPLPRNAKGIVLLTGDDDQAELDKYDSQLALLNDLPMTYFLVPQTRHDSESLSRLKGSVEFGLHPDALDDPANYDAICEEQKGIVEEITGTKMGTVRNHGFLSDGYWGHLRTWERLGLAYDSNLPGLDGTALCGTYLPFRVRREQGSRSDHFSLLTTFGDGMYFAMKMTDQEIAKRIAEVVRKIEKSCPGVIVFNLHPQNVETCRGMHKEAVKLARRTGWISLSFREYMKWNYASRGVVIERFSGGEICLYAPEPVRDLTIRSCRNGEWCELELEEASGFVEMNCRR